HFLHGGAVRERLERVSRELHLRRRLRIERFDQAVRREIADPVVRTNDDVRRVLRLDRLQVVADATEGVLNDRDGDALRGTPSGAALLDRGRLHAVGPDDEGRGSGLARVRRGTGARGGRARSNDKEREGTHRNQGGADARNALSQHVKYV